MSIQIRKSEERGHANHGWLDSYFSFSFAEYHDPKHIGFRSLRVINEDFIQPDNGFGMHPHKDMEIISFVIEGELAHKDSLGNGSTIKPGRIQKMSAGTGVTHSEFNPSKDKQTHLLQIWIIPSEKGIQPAYEELPFDAQKSGLELLGSNHPQNGQIMIRQDAQMYRGQLSAENSIAHKLSKGRGAWIQLIKGSLTINGQKLTPGDGAAIEDENVLNISAVQNTEFLLFDLK